MGDLACQSEARDRSCGQQSKEEGRILSKFSGDNTDFSMNFKPVMDKNELIAGYRKILQEVYSAKSFYNRVLVYLKQYNPPVTIKRRITLTKVVAFLKSIVYLGIFRKNRRYYWRLLLWSLFNKPRTLSLAVTYSIYGYHFRKVFEVKA